jgi:hypothetical protein
MWLPICIWMTEPDEGIEIRRLQNADNAARRPSSTLEIEFQRFGFRAGRSSVHCLAKRLM